MINQAMTPKNIIKVPQMIFSYNRNVKTNMPMALVTKYGLNAPRYDFDKINTVTLPGEPAYVNGISYFIHYEQQTKTLVQDIFNKEII